VTSDWFFAFIAFVAFVASFAFVAFIAFIAFVAFIAWVMLNARRFKVLCSMFEVHTVTVTVTTKVRGSRLEVGGSMFEVQR